MTIINNTFSITVATTVRANGLCSFKVEPINLKLPLFALSGNQVDVLKMLLYPTDASNIIDVQSGTKIIIGCTGKTNLLQIYVQNVSFYLKRLK